MLLMFLLSFVCLFVCLVVFLLLLVVLVLSGLLCFAAVACLFELLVHRFVCALL